MKIRNWKVNTKTWETCPLENLIPLLNSNTRLVAFPHVSNILGEVVDAKRFVYEIKSRFPRILVCIDGVAFAPHGVIDVKDIRCDWYVYSIYKVFGPLFGKHEALEELTGPNHFFIGKDDIPYKFELGGPCHELCAGRLGLKPYLLELANRDPTDVVDREVIVQAFETIKRLEEPLIRKMFEFLRKCENVTVYSSDSLTKCPTISFTHATISSADIVAHLHKSKIACRNGHMYAYDLVCKSMGLTLDGVVRISLVHYNTIEEVDRIINSLSSIL